MTISPNKHLWKNKFFNIQKKENNHLSFLLPTIMISSKKIVAWDTFMFSIFFGLGKYCIQFNIFENIRNNQIQLSKSDVSILLKLLKEKGYQLTLTPQSMKMVFNFLNENSYIISLLKNANLQHDYVKDVICSYFAYQEFIEYKKHVS